jgi:O-antigen ligase
MFKGANLRKNVMWIIIGIFMTVIMGEAIADAKLIYLVAALIPFLIYSVVKKPFLFPFGLYLFFLPFESMLVMESAHGATITKFLGIASILAFLTSGIFEKRIKKPDKTVLWWGLFVAFGIFSILWAIRPELMYRRIFTATGLFLLYFVMSCYKIREKEFDLVKKLIIYGGVAASITEIVLYFFMGVTYDLRASLIYGESRADPNQFSFSLLIPCALSVGAMLSARNKLMKILNWVFLGIISSAILISVSRGALLGVTTIFLTFMFSAHKKNYLLIAMISIISISFLFLPSEILFQRVTKAYETGGSGRLDIWGVGLEALRHYWLLGAGLDNFPKAYWDFGPQFSFLEAGPHNIYLGVAVELGIIGFCFMIFAIYKHYVLTRNRFYRYDNNSVLLKAALFGLLVSSFFLDVIWRKSFWLMWILIMMYNNVKKEKVFK